MEEHEPRDVELEAKWTEAGFITKASAQYCDKFPLRAAIQAIPWLGSSLDTMLAGLGAKWQYERLEDFISKLNERLIRLEQLGNLSSITPSEPLFDFMRQVFDQVIRARSEEKRKWFANLVANQVEKQRDWDKADIACRLVSDLSDIHIEVLDVCVNETKTDPARLLTISDKWSFERNTVETIIDLREEFRSLSDSFLRMICLELASKGLLCDEGVGRYGGSRSNELFVPTDLANWLMDWISEPGGMKNTGDSD